MSVIRKLDSAYPSVCMMRASGSTILWHVTIATAAAIVISRNEILTALEDENDSGSPEVHSLKQRLRLIQFFFLAVTPSTHSLSRLDRLSFFCISLQSFRWPCTYIPRNNILCSLRGSKRRALLNFNYYLPEAFTLRRYCFSAFFLRGTRLCLRN